MNDDLTIPQMIRSYNELVAQATAMGLTGCRPRNSFHHRADAQSYIAKVESMIRAAQGAAKSAPDDAIETAASEVQAVADETATDQTNTEDKMPKTPKTKKPRAVKAKKVANGGGEHAPRKGSKMEIIARLLKRQNGCTAKEVMEACQWPSVSMPAMSKAAGLKLKKSKEKGKVTRYYGE